MRYITTPILIAVLAGMFAGAEKASAAAPVITSSTSVTTTVPGNFSYTITASGSPTWFNAVPVAVTHSNISLGSYGLSVNNSTGVISGSLPHAGTYQIYITAKAGNQTGSATLVVNAQPWSAVLGGGGVKIPPPPPMPPVINSPKTATGTVGSNFYYQTTATNNPTPFGYSWTNLYAFPPGITPDDYGVIQGPAKAAGTYKVTLNASNNAGVGPPFTLTITINPAPH